MFVRYGVPVAILLVGVTVAVVKAKRRRLEAATLVMGAGSVVFLLNALYRLGVSGALAETEKEAARNHLDKYGLARRPRRPQ